MYDKAIEVFEIGKKFAVKEPMPFALNLAEIYKNLGEYDKAEENLNEIIGRIESGYLYYMLGQIYEEKGKDEMALMNYLKAKECKNDKFAGYAGLISYYYYREDTLNAVKYLRESMTQQKAHSDLFWFYLTSGDTVIARFVLQDYLKLRPEDEFAKKLIKELEKK
jgi:tetratricopeptide (TPR) repeat protein